MYDAGMSRMLLVAAFVAVLAPAAGAQTGGPKLLVLNKEDATLVAVDPASGKILGSAPTGEGPHEVTASEDGTLAVAANYGSQTPGSSLSVIDLKTMKELRRVDVSPLRRPHGVVFGTAPSTSRRRPIASWAATTRPGTGSTGCSARARPGRTWSG